MDEITSRLGFKSDSDSEEYEFKAISNSAVYARESEGYLPALYYLVSWKGYPKKENTWEPVLTVLHRRKFISTFHHDHPEKPIASSPPIDSTPPMARPTVKLKAETSSTKQKRSKPANSTSKCIKKNWISSFYLIFGSVSIASKRFSQSRDPRSALLCSLIFQFFCTSQFSPIIRFFLLGIGQEVFTINHPDFSVFFYQFPRVLEVFHQLTHRFSSTIFH